MTEISNGNLHYTNKWRLALLRSPGVQYNCTTADFPSLSMTPVKMPTPVGNFFMGGKIVDFGQFTFTFLVDEDFENYWTIFEWMTAIAGATDTDKYKKFVNDSTRNVFDSKDKDKHNIYSDGTLFSLTNASQINREFHIVNMFPITLGSPVFTQGDNSVNTCTVTFQCDYFELIPKKS